jgi:D-arginine dehydrogenase
MQVDVAIVGGGFAGCATAWALAARGVRAIVLEREPELGRHASGRGAGLGRQLAEDDPTSALTIRGVALLRERFSAAWSPTGGILSFDDPAHAQSYLARARRLQVAHEVIDRSLALTHWPALSGLPIAAAIHVGGDGVIDTRRLLAAFADGVEIIRDASVVRISDSRPGALVETTRGEIAAKIVVDAAGAWAGRLTGDPPLASYKRHLYVLEAAAPAGAPYLWHLGRDELYVRPDGAGVLTCPCDAAPTQPVDQLPDETGDACLRARLGAAAPSLAASAIARRWACQRAFTPDRQMRIGRDPARRWLVWAAGLGGHGATASAAVGELAATAVLEALADH